MSGLAGRVLAVIGTTGSMTSRPVERLQEEKTNNKEPDLLVSKKVKDKRYDRYGQEASVVERSISRVGPRRKKIDLVVERSVMRRKLIRRISGWLPRAVTTTGIDLSGEEVNIRKKRAAGEFSRL